MLNSFINQMKANGRSEKTITSYRYVLTRLNSFRPLEQVTKKDLVEFFTDFDGTQQTKRLFQGIIKKFYIDNGKEDIVNWIQLVSPKIIQSDKNTLTVEDINKLIESTDSKYWKAYISVIFETGARFTELQNVVWSDYKDGIIEIHATKTHTISGTNRRIPLIMSGSYLDNLQLSVKALKDDQIFHYSEEWTVQNLVAIAKSAGITKPVNPHKFRHARATDLVRRGTQEAIIRKILGWTPNSTMIARYQHLNDNSVIDAMTGSSTEREIPEIVPAGNMIDDLRAQIHNHEQDMEDLKADFEDKMSSMQKMIDNFMKGGIKK